MLCGMHMHKTKQEQQVETQEIVDTLEKIINVTKPDFEKRKQSNIY